MRHLSFNYLRMAEPLPKTNVTNRLIDFLVSGFFSGHSPVAPGTAGTIAAVVLVWLLSVFCPEIFLSRNWLITSIALTLLGIWLSNVALSREIYGPNNKDPQRIVIDEFAGYFWAMLALPVTPLVLAVTFFFFRLFDTTKPPPARQFESFPGGWGIVLDDVAAGIYANIAARLVLMLIG